MENNVMIIKFSEEFNLSASEVYTYFHTPADWTRLFGFPGNSLNIGDGWYKITLKNFPFPLEAKNTHREPEKVVKWVFRGFWCGQGEVRFIKTNSGVIVKGYEEISVRWLFFISPFFERLFLERSFRAIWEIGWHRLHKRERSKSDAS